MYILGGLYKIGRILRKNMYSITDETNRIYEEMIIKVCLKKDKLLHQAKMINKLTKI
jgi:hypothetical protein